MEGLSQLVLFSLVMLAGSYGAGSVPLFMPMSEEKLHLVSVMGAGLLLGVAFAVIVPEGMLTLIKAFQLKAKHNNGVHTNESSGHHHAHGREGGEVEDSLEGIDRTIGISLVLGFLFMMLIDQIAASSHSSRGASLPTSDPDAPSRKASNGGGGAGAGGVSWTTTLGLVVHAAADGIAMGAAASTHQVDVELIVFLAIMLHKAPAAFGLVTFLMHENLDRARIKKHLLAFSFAAPVLAISTYSLLSISKGDSDDTLGTFHATGVAMLFSAGTFLYVSTVHVLPEVTGSGSGKGFSKCELLMLVLGALLPLLLTLGHHH